MKMRKNKRNKGITLIALIITIIILLILAGVSISLVVGDNGVVDKASNASVISREAKAKEEILMAWTGVSGEYYTEWTENTNLDKVEYFSDEEGRTRLNKYLTETGEITEGPNYNSTTGKYTVKYRAKDQNQLYTFIIDENGNLSVKKNVYVSSLSSITPGSAIVNRGESLNVIVTVNEGATESLIWTSESNHIEISDPVIDETNNTQEVIVKVLDSASSGEKIRVIAQNNAGTLTENNIVEITVNVPVTGVVLKRVETGGEIELGINDTVMIAPNGTKNIKAEIRPADATNASIKTINWSIENASSSGLISYSNNSTTGSTSSGGVITVIAGSNTGTARIKATVEGTEIINSCEVVVDMILEFNSVTSPNATDATNCIGCYASIDGNNTPDGIIYADYGKGGSGTGCGASFSYSALKGADADNMKEYVISDTTVNGYLGNRKLIKISGNNTGTVERFHIMALTDWTQGYLNVVMTSVPEGWYIPSKNEWAAFLGNLHVSTKNFSSFRLSGSNHYWAACSPGARSSDSFYYNTAYCSWYPDSVDHNYLVRLYTIF